MKLVMTLLCRDEAEIIDANLRFHLEQGVDYIIAMNNLSNDETVSLLEGYERSGVLTLIHQTEDHFDQDLWVTQMARMAAMVHGADWVINNDADEFWWPAQGTLKEVLAAFSNSVEMVVVSRNNFIPSVSEVGPFYERMRIREACSRNALGNPLQPKACHRGFADIAVTFGNHSAQRGQTPLTAIDGSGRIDILHFPLRTYQQFERKIVLGTAALNRNSRLDQGICNTWRWLLNEYHHGRLPEYYQAQVLSAAAEEEGLRSGTLVRDDRLYRFFHARDRGKAFGDRSQPCCSLPRLEEAPGSRYVNAER